MALEAPYEPVELNKVQQAFPADALDYMPDADTARTWLEEQGRDAWQLKFQQDWMFRGVEDLQFIPRDGSWTQVEVDRAFVHLGAIQASYAPKHEHKEAAIAFLVGQWFEFGRWKRIGEDEWQGSEWPEYLNDATLDAAEEARRG